MAHRVRPRAPGLRARVVITLFATAAATLAVAALALLPPLEQRLRVDAAHTLVLRAEAARPGFERLRAHQIRGPRLNRLLHALARTTGAQVVLVSEQGQAADTDPDAPGDLSDAVRVVETRRAERSVSSGIATAAVPLRMAGRPYALALRRRLGDVGRTYTVVETAFGWAAGAGLALALIGGLLLSGRMLRRLRRLRDAVRSAELDEPIAPDPHRDELGELARTFAELQARLAGQEAARRTFVATASHELRTPLASLQSLLELVSEELADPDADLAALREDVDHALGQARRLGGLSVGLLDLSRLDAGIQLRSEPVELGELSRAVASEFRARSNAGLERPRWTPADPCWAVGDPDSVARIVRLLIDNALRYAPAPAPVEIRTETSAETAVVRVLDGGAGVAQDERASIFERFRRGESSGAPGFGLGLAIGRELARRMGGELLLQDTPGALGGAEFALVLPAAPESSVTSADRDEAFTAAG